MSTTARWSLIIGIGVAATLAFSFFAALTADDRKTLAFIVFAIVMAPACIGSAWALFPSENDKAPAYPEDTVETEWESQGRLRRVHRLDHCHGDRADRAQCLRRSRTAARNVYSPRAGRLRNPVLGSVEGPHPTFEI